MRRVFLTESPGSADAPAPQLFPGRTTVRYRLFTAGLALLFVVSAQAQTPAANGPPVTTMVVTFKVKPGKNEAFEKAFLDMQKSVKANEPGNINYDFYHDSKDPQSYVIIERYKDAAAVTAHGQSDHGKKLIATLGDMLDGKPEAMRLVLIKAKE
jgi:quinol monooxygenase YgiN